jgi:hypothetical protein
MGEDLDKLYKLQSGYQFLEDLRTFSESETIPIIDQVAGVFDNLWGVFSREERALENCQFIESLIRKEIKSDLESHLLNNAEYKELHVVFEEDKYSVETWEKILISLKSALKLLHTLKAHQYVTVTIGSEKTKIESTLAPTEYSEQTRIDVYKVFREALGRSILQTFHLKESSTQGPSIELLFDYSHSQSKWMTFSFPEQKLFLKFSNILNNYRYTFNDNRILQGSAIVLSKDLEVINYDPIQSSTFSKLIEASDEFEAFHFPFIFRPVWLIIPVKGILRDASVMGGWEQDSKNQWSEPQSRYLDLFKLLSR